MAHTALALVLFSLFSAGSAAAEIYRWTDAEGKLHFTQDLSQVPPSQRSQAKSPARDGEDRLQRYAAPARIESTQPTASNGEIKIPFERRGTLMRVEAVVNGRHRVPFLVDTGASGVSLPSEVVAQLGIPIRRDTPRVTVSTANGLVRFPLIELDSVQLGDARVEGLEATVNPTMSIGLLGGKFFNNYRYSVDAAAGEIILEPNDGIRAGEAAEQWRERFRGLRNSITRLETHLGSREISRKNQQAELESNLDALKQELRALETEANHARVPHSWRE
jgi:clan AA aspartic protease (TIGR02281 family)